MLDNSVYGIIGISRFSTNYCYDFHDNDIMKSLIIIS